SNQARSNRQRPSLSEIDVESRGTSRIRVTSEKDSTNRTRTATACDNPPGDHFDDRSMKRTRIRFAEFEAVQHSKSWRHGSVRQPAANLRQDWRRDQHASIRNRRGRLISRNMNSNKNAASHAGIASHPDWATTMPRARI